DGLAGAALADVPDAVGGADVVAADAGAVLEDVVGVAPAALAGHQLLDLADDGEALRHGLDVDLGHGAALGPHQVAQVRHRGLPGIRLDAHHDGPGDVPVPLLGERVEGLRAAAVVAD